MRQIKRISDRAAKVKWLMGAMALGLLSSLAAPVQAQERFGNQVIQFPVDTTVEFEVESTHGANQSAFGVRNLSTGQDVDLFVEQKPFDGFGTGQPQPSTGGADDSFKTLDYPGTVTGGTIIPGRNVNVIRQSTEGEGSLTVEYTFQANTQYVLYLKSVTANNKTPLPSFDSTNQAAAFFAGSLDGGSGTDPRTNRQIVGNLIKWDDNGIVAKDEDYDDFVIEAGGYLINVTCPPVK